MPSDRDEADVEARHYARLRRSAALPKPPDIYGQHQRGWEWSRRVLNARQEGVWHPFRDAWRLPNERG